MVCLFIYKQNKFFFSDEARAKASQIPFSLRLTNIDFQTEFEDLNNNITKKFLKEISKDVKILFNLNKLKFFKNTFI